MLIVQGGRFAARLCCALLIAASGSALADVANPSFESNGGVATQVFTSWTVANTAGMGGSPTAVYGPAPNGVVTPSGWLVQTGTTSPINAFPVPAPTDGNFAAMTDQTGPGAHVIYQDIAIPAGGGSVAFDLFLNSSAAFAAPPTLDPSAQANQQFRADFVSTAADPFDVGAGVLQNLYQTQAADPTVVPYRRITVAISAALGGQTVRLRFAEVDNLGFFNVGIDNVALVPAGPVAAAISAPALDTRSLALLALVLGLGAAVALRRRA